MALPLTVTVITLDAERDLARCLASTAWAAEHIVVDAGSTDRTVEIAERCGARVVRRAWTGFVDQKNHALELAGHDRVLSLDADEWLPEHAEGEVAAAIERPIDAFRFRRRTAFCGAFVGVWSPDWQTRLFTRSAGRFAGGSVHESFRLAAGVEVAPLETTIYHNGYRTIREYVERMNRYTDLAAADLVAAGVRPSRRRLWLSPPAAFLRHLLIKRGLLDGPRGWVISAGSAWSVLLKYAKHWEACREADPTYRRLVPPTPDDPD